jgi:serine/threonine-protein kinase
MQIGGQWKTPDSSLDDMRQLTPDPLFLAFQLALAGRYSIDRELGRGGMGVVYLAREVHLDRLVAIKLLPPEKALQPMLRERFLQEARLAAKLSHPHIIPIHAVDETEGFVYYVMSYVDGETLAERVRSRGPLSASDGTRMLREVAWALAYAHSTGLVHRDVKPDNILLETASGRALVADFGIAAAVGSVSSDGVSGTPEFMSPEQALGGEIDARSDLYGLGATAFYAFSGRLPFEGRTPTEILAKHVTESAPPLASLGLAVPRKLAQLVDRCLAKEPSQRPPSADALAEQLGVALDQRRELPAALRVFAKRTGRLHGGVQVVYAVSLLPASIVVSSVMGQMSGLATFVAGAGLGALAFGASAARRMLSQGFAQADLTQAFAAELANSREERAADYSRGSTFLETVTGHLTRILGTFSAVAIPITLTALIATNYDPLVRTATTVVQLIAEATAVLGISYLALRQVRRDVDTEFWNAVWTGKVGRFFFSVAKRVSRGAPVVSSMTHRATELSLGMAADQLYESLPKAAQQQLGALPDLLRRLQHDAQTLRRRLDQLQEAITDAGVAANSPEYESVRHSRDLTSSKLAEAVGALETIRLNLLRLHAGSATVEGLTTHLGIAVDVSDEIDRMIAAQDEVESHLRFPSEAEPTPV